MDARALSILLDMSNNTLDNYILPGLSSHLVGGGGYGKVRLFEASRRQQSGVTPHSHRFDFTCLVLRGSVVNTIWTPDSQGDEFFMQYLEYQGQAGEYQKREYIQGVDKPGYTRWTGDSIQYAEGQWYSMSSEEIHSIEFSRDALVLFFEGPERSKVTKILEPIAGTAVIPTLKVEPWMFVKRESNWSDERV